MIKKITSFLEKYYPILLITSIWLMIVLTNYAPHSWLTGWDNLHPEFNFSINIKRSLYSAWQEYQGLGLLGGMGHGADLVRQIFLWIFSFIIPANSLRYFYVFLMLLVGAIGAYIFVNNFTKNKSQYPKLIGLFAGLFYMLNIGTVQNFHVPFEPFVWFFGFFPWLIHFLLAFLQSKNNRFLGAFTITSFLATPLGYLQTAFLNYTLIVSIFLFVYLFSFYKEKRSLKKFLFKLKKTILIILIIAATNAFWLLPVVHFTLSDVGVTVDSKINSIATHEVYFQNKEYGSLDNILQLKGFWFSVTDINENNQAELLLQPWIDHFDSHAKFFLFTFSLMIISGLFWLNKKSSHWNLAFATSFLLIVIMLAGENPPFGFIIYITQNFSPIFSQIFRSPFTKWIVPASFIFSLLFALGLDNMIDFLLKIFTKKRYKKIIVPIFSTALILSLVFYSLPSFQGNFIYPRMRQQIPKRYFHLFDFFKKQPKEKRIATLPANSIFGWYFYDWGYRGSGFLWYGIEQPILDRTFDVWSRYDESFYHELSTAIYGENQGTFNKVLNKYDVSYIIIDESIIAPGSKNNSSLKFSETKKYLNTAGATIAFQEGPLTVYFLANPNNTDGFITFPQKASFIRGTTTFSRKDQILEESGDYLSFDDNLLNKNEWQNKLYPFADITKENLNNLSYDNFDDNLAKVTLLSQEQLDEKQYILHPPKLKQSIQYSFPIKVELLEESLLISVSYPFTVVDENNNLILQIDPVQIDFELPEYMPTATFSHQNNYIIKIGETNLSVSPSKKSEVNIVTLETGQELEIELFKVSDTSSEQRLVLKKINSYKLDYNFWESFNNSVEKKIVFDNQVNKSKKLAINTLSLPLKFNFSYADNIYNCDFLKRGEINREVSDNIVTLAAKDYAALCDGYSIAKIKKNQNFLLRIKKITQSGFGLKFYYSNWKKPHTDIIALLNPDQFEVSYGTLLWPFIDKGEYAIDFESRSLGREPNINRIELIEVHDFPLELIADFHLTDNNQTNALIYNSKNNVLLKEIKKWGTYKYAISVETKENSFLVLSQGKDKGWLAFQAKNDQPNPFEKIIRFAYPHFYGKQLEKGSYNNWANAWLLPKGDYEVVIIYWPQLLIFASYGLLIGTGIYLTRATTKKTHKYSKIKHKTKHHLQGN